MAGLSYVQRRHQALCAVGQSDRPVAGDDQGGADRPFPSQTAAPHQGSDQHAVLRTDGGDDPGLQRTVDVPDPRGVRFRRRHLVATRPATNRTAAAARPPPGQPRAAAMTSCVSTTPASATRPTSARRAALTRKTNRPAAGPQLAAAAGPIPACRPPLCCNT